MKIFSICILAGFSAMLLLSRKMPPELKKGDPVIRNAFTKMGFLLQFAINNLFKRQVSGPEGGQKRKEDSVQEALKILYPGKEKKEIALYYKAQNLGNVLMLFLTGTVFLLFLSIQPSDRKLREDGVLNRSRPGGEEVMVDLQAAIEGEEETSIAVEVQAQTYTEKQLNELFVRMLPMLENAILGENITLDEVRHDLILVEEIKDYPFTVQWQTSDYFLMDEAGRIGEKRPSESGEILTLTAVVTCQELIWEHEFAAYILPPLRNTGEALFHELQESVVQAEAATRQKQSFRLPRSVNGKNINWKEKTEDYVILLPLLLLAACIGIYLGQDREVRKRLQERNRQLLLDYPQVVSKLALFLGAGMTARSALKRIAQGYETEKRKGKDERYIYEEIRFAIHEMESSVSEEAAYRNWGKRCGMPQYKKLSTLLVQNLQKGSAGLTKQMKEETEQAFEIRKDMARRMGEEAGTKLLLPMMMMLAIVMILIMIPAYFSFSMT